MELSGGKPMRLIDADALKEAFYRKMKELLLSTDTPQISNEALSLLCGASLIADAPTIEPEPQWIPCSERLPETEEQVLIYAWNAHYVLAKYKEIRTCDDVYKMAWVTEDAYSIPREIKHEVICWMPLPEPAKMENN